MVKIKKQEEFLVCYQLKCLSCNHEWKVQTANLTYNMLKERLNQVLECPGGHFVPFRLSNHVEIKEVPCEGVLYSNVIKKPLEEGNECS